MGRVTEASTPTSGPSADDVTWLRPSPRLLALRRAQVRAGAVALLIGAGIAAGFFPLPGLLAAAAVVVAGVFAEVIAIRRFRRWGYAERAEDLMVRRGVMVRRLSVVPYGRMQFVDVVAGPLERRWGLATVRLHTAAAASDARVPGLPASEAERLRDRLALLGESRAAGL
jgi:membrane protein YdbS with pleckstrin-like domain